MYCEYCGNELDENSGFCTQCGMPVKIHSDKEVTKGVVGRIINNTNTTQTIVEPKLSMPKSNANATDNNSNIVLADGEVVVKKYNCAHVRDAKGCLTVTNKRMMFNAKGKTSRYNQEITLSSVSGLSSYRGTNVDLRGVIMGAVMIIVGLFILLSSVDSFAEGIGTTIGFIMAVLGFLILISAIRPAFQIAIYAKDVSLSPIVIGEGAKSLLGNSAMLVFSSTPTKETDIMLDELGALVQDLQSMGDLAIEKWQNKVNSKDLPSF